MAREERVREQATGELEALETLETLEARILRDRRETLGRLAAGVAHEINNPAAYILLGLDLLERQLGILGIARSAPGAGPAFELLGELRASVARIVELTRDLRQFANPPPGGAVGGTEVARAIDAALSLARGSVLERAEVTSRLEGSPVVALDPGSLAHVLVALLAAAVELLPREGHPGRAIAISARGAVDEGEAGEAVEIAVALPCWAGSKLPRLAVPRAICERAGGSLVVETPFGDEVRMIVRLPVAGRGSRR